MNKIAESLIILMSVCLTQISYAEDEVSEAFVSYELEKGQKNNKAFGVEVAQNLMVLKPNLFTNTSLNEKSLSLLGPSLSLTKSFRLGASAFTISNLRGSYSELKGASLNEIDFDRKSAQILVQFVQQFGFNIFTMKIDSGTLHPYFGIGGYWSEFKDEYNRRGTEKLVSSFNKINDSGILGEVGLTLMDQMAKVYLTVRATATKSLSSKVVAQDLPNASLAANSSDVLSASVPMIYSLGFGIRF